LAAPNVDELTLFAVLLTPPSADLTLLKADQRGVIGGWCEILGPVFAQVGTGRRTIAPKTRERTNGSREQPLGPTAGNSSNATDRRYLREDGNVVETELETDFRTLRPEPPVQTEVGAVPRTEVTVDPSRPRSMQSVVGSAQTLVDIYSVVDRVADTTCTVLITGESGTGKELVARGVHDQSSRRGGPFVAVNCGAIPEALLESELFGHTRGAFTGAHQTKVGHIGVAAGGSLFLDEIGELTLPLQVKLLRVLQSHEYSPVGETRVLKANVRVIAATNIDLERAVEEGKFRQDLYYRLNVIHLLVPPLRDRNSDVPALVAHFLVQHRTKTGRVIRSVSRSAMRLLCEYDWPGNVRELENTIERAMLLCASDRIEPTDLPMRLRGLGSPVKCSTSLPDAGIDLRAAVESYENDLIRQALDRTGWNKNRAAQLLQLNRTTLVEMLKRKRIGPRAA
jgi:transcriptional regulator with PAS, ATPase and Fis domain